MGGFDARAIPTVSLTKEEKAIMDGIANGFTRKEVAQRRGVSAGTVQHMLRVIEAKLGARSTEQAVAVAIRRGLL